MTDNDDKIQSVVEYMDACLWGIVRRPRMYAPGGIDEAERLISFHVDIRAMLLGKTTGDWRRWYRENYPEIPGPVRCIAAAVQARWPVGEHDVRFTAEMLRALSYLEGLRPPGEDERQDSQGEADLIQALRDRGWVYRHVQIPTGDPAMIRVRELRHTTDPRDAKPDNEE